MRKEILTSIRVVIVLTVLLGLAYPLLVTGITQVLAPNKANGSLLKHDGKTVGSHLIGQDFKGKRFFQSRPSSTNYNAAATAFSNAGPNSRKLKDTLKANLAAYLARERTFNPSLTAGDVPADAVMTSASNIDPHISVTNAQIQAMRVAAVRKLSQQSVLILMKRHTDGRFIGLFGEPGVNVLELNLALERGEVAP